MLPSMLGIQQPDTAISDTMLIQPLPSGNDHPAVEEPQHHTPQVEV